ncbi:MAG: succinate dehydrogenase, cytochrome b556 subunit [Legionellales bacterium]|nr:succinate dehydrogenase, cytochrome b556 subunit [Legionellales bacterium]
MKDPRPVNLDLTKFKFPLPAIGSILHRITGVIFFLLIPFLLYGLKKTLASPESFQVFQTGLTHQGMLVLIWISLTIIFYHFAAGIRHLLMDLGCAETLRGGRVSTMIVFGVTILFIILTGIWLWQ